MEYDILHDHCVIDSSLWKELKNADREKIIRNTGASFDPVKQCYRIPVLNEEFAVFPAEEKIEMLPDYKCVTQNEVDLCLFLLHYLLGAKDVPVSGEKISEKELKGGEMFFRGLHAIPTADIKNRYGRNPEGLIKAGEKLSGRKAEFGDASIQLTAAPKITVIYVLWAADDEFPASVTVLFDPSIQEFLPLDVIFGMCIYIYKKLIINN